MAIEETDQNDETTAAPVGSTAASSPFERQALLLLNGIQELVPAGTVLPTLGGSVSQAILVSQLTAVVQAHRDVQAQILALKQARQALAASLPLFEQQVQAAKNAMIGFLPHGSPLFAKLGFKPRGKPRPLTTEQHAVRVAKALATRKLRGTLGKRQKRSVKFVGELQMTVAPAPPDGASVGAGGRLTPTPPNPPSV